MIEQNLQLTKSINTNKLDQLKITEIFLSLQGETSRTGLPTVFVRLTGCPLRCGYCDSEYAFYGGKRYNLSDIEDKVASYSTKHVVITGGEPLAQKNVLKLMANLCDKGYEVSLETSGAMDIGRVDRRVALVLDLKTPGSKEEKRNLYSNLKYLKKSDEIKFVLCDRNDYIWAKEVIFKYKLLEQFSVLFSPSYGELEARALADWIVADRLAVRMQIQLHKYIWGDVPGK